jgi:PAS domain S-box-containing protein
VLGRSVGLIFPSDRADELSAVLACIRRGETVEPYETERVRKDGRRISVSVSVAPVRHRAGAVVGAMAAFPLAVENKIVGALGFSWAEPPM